MPIGSGAPPGFYDLNGKRYREGNTSPLTPEEVIASEGGTATPTQHVISFGRGRQGDAERRLIQTRKAWGDAAGAHYDPEDVRQAAEDARNYRDEAAAKKAEDQRNFEIGQRYENRFNYGGWQGGAQDFTDRLGAIGENAQRRPGEVVDTYRASDYRNRAEGHEGGANIAAALMLKRAYGFEPSVAGMRADQDMRRLAAEQSSAAASARGPAALALAQQQAAANTSAGQSAISNQAQINAAQERLQAEQGAYGAYSGLRGQDFTGQGLEQQAAQKQAELNAAQRAENDRLQEAAIAGQIDVNKAQLGAQGNKQAIEAGQATAASSLEAQKKMHSQDRTDKYVAAGLSTAGAVGGVLAAGLLGGGGDKSPPGGNDGSNRNSGTGGYDSSGAPVASSGGGFDPNDPNNGSDERMKQSVVPLYEDPTSGVERHWDRDVSTAQPAPMGARLSGRAPRYSIGEAASRRQAMSESAVPKAKARKYSDDELKRLGEEMIASQSSKGDAMIARGPAVSDKPSSGWLDRYMASSTSSPVSRDLAQGLAPFSYEYKPGFREQERQEPGERNVGPMAQNMAANPVTRTAVKEGDNGMLYIDQPKAGKLALAGIGHLAAEQQRMKAEMARMRGGR